MSVFQALSLMLLFGTFLRVYDI
ncbi:putative holin-like toxin [Lactiplantibacillus pentosus]